ncbi:MAG: D-isomer specific 2-hydroxyacid dehydrogenase family protein [Salinibacterium sp.]|nr:D-isomer specific 2-hydroxyacid dehydrogenase family protein [Salinibacterium sp.]
MPEPGLIAILPAEREPFSRAVRASGGVIAPLSDDTRGVVWLSPSGAKELEKVLDAHPSLTWVQLPWAGVDSFCGVLARFADRTKPLWTSAKGAYAEPVAEHALALTLAVLRQLPEKSRSRSWAGTKQGISLYGRHVVIIGAGGIAVELLRLLAPFEVQVTVVRRSGGPLPGAHRTVLVDELADVLPQADVVIVAAAATSETRHLIGGPELAAMKADAALINIARGPLIDTDALVEALSRGHLWGAGLDVTDPEPLPDGHPLWSAPRVIITSHCADTPEMTEPLLAERVALNVAALMSGSGRFVGVVDPVAGY